MYEKQKRKKAKLKKVLKHLQNKTEGAWKKVDIKIHDKMFT